MAKCKALTGSAVKGLNRLRHIQNALAHAVVAAPRSSSPNHILRSLHWLEIKERIECIFGLNVLTENFKVC